MAVIAPLALITLAGLPLAAVPARQVLRAVTGRDLIAVLGETGRLQLIFGLLLTVGLAIRP
jgi:1,4-dihydroxy-2-naphthoate octaprenyltransferase